MKRTPPPPAEPPEAQDAPNTDAPMTHAERQAAYRQRVRDGKVIAPVEVAPCVVTYMLARGFITNADSRRPRRVGEVAAEILVALAKNKP
jgi:hypothetical protein